MKGQQLHTSIRQPEILAAARRLRELYATNWDCYLHEEEGVPYLIAFVPDKDKLRRDTDHTELLAGEIGYTSKKLGILELVVPESDPLTNFDNLYNHLQRWTLLKYAPYSLKGSRKTQLPPEEMQ
jgi:hypothetical protein